MQVFISYITMALPIFLRPLLLIGHYYRLLTRNITGWLEHSNDQYVPPCFTIQPLISRLFGPLEQMIVAVVITGLGMSWWTVYQADDSNESWPLASDSPAATGYVSSSTYSSVSSTTTSPTYLTPTAPAISGSEYHNSYRE